MESLKGKQVLITGATGGIGAATAKLLSASGAKLFLTARNAARLEELAAGLGLTDLHNCQADLTKPSDIDQLKQRYFSVYPQLDILINAAGVGIISPLETLSNEAFLNTLHSNLYAPFLLMKSFLPAMKEVKRGLVINIPGVLGKVPMAGAAAYSASKYGLTGMMQSIREELKRTDIRITNVFLGGVDSAFWDNIELRVQREKMIRPEEAARSIWFLCQQPASGVVSELVLQPFNHQAI